MMLISAILAIAVIAGIIFWYLGYAGVVLATLSSWYVIGVTTVSAVLAFGINYYTAWMEYLSVGFEALVTGSNWYYATFFVGFVMLAAVIIGNLAITLTDGKKGFKVIR